MNRTSTKRFFRLPPLGTGLIICMMLVPLLTRAQTITLNQKDVALSTVLRSITDQSGYKFVYSVSIIDTKQKVSVNVSGDITTVLDAVFSGTGITYKIADKQVALSRAAASPDTPRTSGGTRRITGTLTDQNNHKLPGAYIIIDGGTGGTSTDAQGFYIIEVPDDPKLRLRYSYLGMETQIIPIGQRDRIDVTFMPDNVALERLIVTGYQTISKERSAGSYSVVSGSDIKDKAVIKGSVLESLEGTAPGFNINVGSEGDKFLVRGVTSINSNRSPLFVVDGVSIPADMIESMLGGSDVQNVTVLKDATAASIWGAQAANGVVVITTKRGTPGEDVNISYNGSFTFRGKPDYSYLNYMDSRMFIKNATEVFDPEGYKWDNVTKDVLTPVLPHEIPLYQHYLTNTPESKSQRDAELERLSGLDRQKAYEKYMMSNAWLTNHSVSVSGGNQKHTFYVSTSYQGNQGNLKNNSNEFRINARDNVNITKWLNLDLSLNASYGKEKSHLTNFSIDENPGAVGLPNLPYAVFHDENGNELSFTHYLINDGLRADAEEMSEINLDYYPLQDFKNTTQEDITKNIRANAGLTVNIVDGLKYEGRLSYYTSNGRRETHTPSESYNVRLDRVYATGIDTTNNDAVVQYLPSSGGYFQVRNQEEESYTVRNQFSYDKEFGGGRHQVTALLGNEISQTRTRGYISTMMGYDKQTMQSIFYDDYFINVHGAYKPALMKLATGDKNYIRSEYGRFRQEEITYRYVSFYSNAAYTFDHKYSLNASIRVDQSNLFGSDPSVQFKPIWSVGGIWNIGTEEFLDNANWLDLLHLRASFGFSGNSPEPGQGGPFDIIAATTDPRYSDFGIGYIIETPANDKLSWEKTRTINLGVSFGIYGNRLTGSIDLYNKKTTDLLAYSPTDPTTGYTFVLRNIGEMSNKGFEVALSSRNFTGKKFAWTTDATFSYNRNRIVEMYFTPPQSPYGQVVEQYAEGRPANALFAYRWAGLDPEDGAARVYDSNGEAVRAAEELEDVSAIKYMGTTTPPWSASLTNTFRYRNFEISFMFIGNFGHKMRNDTYTQTDSRLTTNIHKDMDKRWRNPGDEKFTNIPSFYTREESAGREGAITFLRYADINVLNASYIKLRELSLGYYLPQKICRALGARSIKARVQSNNLWTIAFNSKGIDPEAMSLRYGSRTERYKPSISGSLSIDF